MQQAQPAAPAGTSAAGYADQYPYHGDAPLRLVSKVTDTGRRLYDAAMGLSREQRLAAGMVACLALQLLLIWLIKRYMEEPQEVRDCYSANLPIHLTRVCIALNRTRHIRADLSCFGTADVARWVECL